MATGVGPPAGNRCRQEDENDDGRGHPPNPPIRPTRPSVKPHVGGYDCEFVKRPASDLVQANCPVCLLVLREPQLVSCCGYSYCQSCIQRVQADQNLCPTCNEQFTTFPNKGLKRALYGQKVYCVHHKLGCEWEGELGELDRHLNLQPPPEKLLEGCQFSEVECTLCLQPFQRHYLQAHQSDDCPKRPFACQHCNQHEATFEEVTQSHWPVCPSFPLTCPNNCDLVLQRQELEQHVRYDCLLTPVYCDFYMSGCGEVLPRRDMPSHITTNIAGHLSLLEEHMRTHPAGVNNVACMVLMLGTIQKIATENAYTRSQLQETNKQLQKPHVKITESHDQLCKLKESHDQLRESYDQLLESHEHSRESHDKLYKSHYQLRESYDQLLESHEHSRESHDINKSHVKVCESYEWLRASYDQLHESHDKLRESHDQCRNDLSSAQDRVAQLEETVISQNEEYQRRMEENHQLANKMEKSQEKMAQLERAMTTHTIRCEKQERRIDAAMTQSHEMVSQQVSGLQVQESLAQQKDELTMMMKASEEKLDKSLATTETKFQTLLATFEAKLQRSLVNSEEKLQASLAKQQTMITEFSNDSTRLSQTINEQERKHGQKVADLQKVIDKKKSESMEKMRAMENQLQTSLATQKATILAKYRSLEACEEQLRASLAAQQTKCSDENRQLRQAITKQERKQSETETKMEKLVDEKKSELTKKIRAIENNLQTSLAAQQTTILAKCSDENRQLRQAISKQKKKQQENEATVMSLKDDFSHKIAASEQNIRDQEATLTLHQQTLKRVTYIGELPFDFTMTEFKSKKKNDVDWYSPPFYTHTHGYRMCIRVNANGNGDEKGTHLSVLAYLMQGPFDDDLMWPFQGVITIQLLNQLEDGNHHTHTINFTGTTDPTIINKVTCGERAGSAWGTHTSLSHTQLDLNSKGNCQYLKDDQLKFRVSKATNLDLTSHIHRRCLKLESFAGAIEPQVAVAPIEFTLSDFEQQKNEDSVWISPAFHTHQLGYRMCLEVYPNGIIDGQGKHVSIFTCLMRGPFDDGLKWPLRVDVTIQIVDQAGEKHREIVVPYNNNTHDSRANRVTDKERSLGWGFDTFLPHTSLGYNTVTNTQYLRANSLQIRISKVEIKN